MLNFVNLLFVYSTVMFLSIVAHVSVFTFQGLCRTSRLRFKGRRWLV